MAQKVLDMTPKEALYFEPPFDKPRETTIRLENVSGVTVSGAGTVTYKVKTTSPMRYVVKPRMGILAPDEKQVIKISLRPVTSTGNLRDKFQIEYRLLTQAETESLAKPGSLDLARLWKENTLPAVSARLSCVFGSPLAEIADPAQESGQPANAFSSKDRSQLASPLEAIPPASCPADDSDIPVAPAKGQLMLSQDELILSQDELTELYNNKTKLQNEMAESKQKDETISTLRRRLDEQKGADQSMSKQQEELKREKDKVRRLEAAAKQGNAQPKQTGSKLPVFLLLILCLILIAYILHLQGHI